MSRNIKQTNNSNKNKLRIFLSKKQIELQQYQKKKKYIALKSFPDFDFDLLDFSGKSPTKNATTWYVGVNACLFSRLWNYKNVT